MLLFTIFITSNCFAQTDEKFVYSYALWGSKLECIHLVNRSIKPEIKEHTLVDKNGSVIKFNNPIEFVNYLSNKGWELIQVLYAPSQYNDGFIYYFRKKQSEFTQDELSKILVSE